MGIYQRHNKCIENDDWVQFRKLVSLGYMMTQEDLIQSDILGNIPMLEYLVDNGLIDLSYLYDYISILPINLANKVLLNKL